MNWSSNTRLAAPVLTALAAIGPIALPALADGDGQWRTLQSLNTPRQEIGAARIGGHVYVTGGLLAGFPFTATETVERYDIAADSWSFVASMPLPLHHHATVAYGGRLYVIGGYSVGFAPRDEVWIYDPASNAWSAGAPMPVPRGACWAVTHFDRVYLFGGEGPSGTSATTLIYDPVADSWSQGADMPTAREHLNAVSLGDFIYVIGGRDGPSNALNERYQPATDQWQTLTPMPTARSAGAAAAYGGRIYMMGGEVPVLSAVNESYDPTTDTWATGPPMPVARHGVAAVTLDDRILTPAGGVVQGLGPTSFVDSFVPVLCPATIVFCTCAAASPCGNVDASAGCANSTGQGSRAFVAGSSSVATDDLVLTADRLPAGEFGLFFMGSGLASFPFGDGLRCVGSGHTGLFRYPVQSSGAGGQIALGPGIAAFSAASFGASGTIAPGSTWNFQCWYRDPAGPCGSTFNASQAVGVTFAL